MTCSYLDYRSESNAQLVERTREIARLLGRPVATPDEARDPGDPRKERLFVRP